MPECNQWTQWSEWSLCSATCGEGQRKRERVCRYGEECKGEGEEVETCNENPCPRWLAWQSWSVCSTTCGRGVQERQRECDSKNFRCLDGFPKEQRICDVQPCPTW